MSHQEAHSTMSVRFFATRLFFEESTRLKIQHGQACPSNHQTISKSFSHSLFLSCNPHQRKSLKSQSLPSSDWSLLWKWGSGAEAFLGVAVPRVPMLNPKPSKRIAKCYLCHVDYRESNPPQVIKPVCRASKCWEVELRCSVLRSLRRVHGNAAKMLPWQSRMYFRVWTEQNIAHKSLAGWGKKLWVDNMLFVGHCVQIAGIVRLCRCTQQQQQLRPFSVGRVKWSRG